MQRFKLGVGIKAIDRTINIKRNAWNLIVNIDTVDSSLTGNDAV
jgi:hypothetical protein